MLPNKQDNIYPRTTENINAILDYYFNNSLGDLRWLYEQRELEINQIEFIAKNVSENIELLIKKVNGSVEMTVSNAIRYGVDALCSDLENVKQTNRVRITKFLKQAIIEKD